MIYVIVFLAGLYLGWVLWAPYRQKAFMSETCSKCGGHGMLNGYENNVRDCPECFCGRVDRRGVVPFLCRRLFKWC